MMTHPWEFDGTVERAEKLSRKSTIPFSTGSEYAISFKLHWLGAQHYFQSDAPKKLLLHTDRRTSSGRSTTSRRNHRWYEIWLKGQNTGIMYHRRCATGSWEPTSANRNGLAAAGDRKWTKYYLSHWETLSTEASGPASELGAAAREPDVFTQIP